MPLPRASWLKNSHLSSRIYTYTIYIYPKIDPIEKLQSQARVYFDCQNCFAAVPVDILLCLTFCLHPFRLLQRFPTEITSLF